MRGLYALGITTAVCLCAATPGVGHADIAGLAGPLPLAKPVQLVLPLVANQAGLQRFALAVTRPGSARYGQYQSIGELARRFGASASTRNRVVGFIRAVGATGVKADATGLFVDATMKVGLAERLFASGVPPALGGSVAGVIGLGATPRFEPRYELLSNPSRATSHDAAVTPSGYARATGTQRGCAQGRATGAFTPSQYRTAYDFDPLQRAGIDGQSERVALIEIDGFSSSDIATFAGCFGVHVPPITAFPVDAPAPLPPGPESTLDIEVLSAAAPYLKAIDVYETNGNAADFLKALTAPLQNPGHEPQVVSDSVGDCEPDLAAGGATLTNAYESTLEMYAASGITFVAESGDRGSADCVDSSGAVEDRLAVDYPASSAWATGVGGTNLILDGANRIAAQLVWNDTTAALAAGGGGSSALFTRPAYQRLAVWTNSRAVPDVAMLGDIGPGYAIYCSAPECVANGRRAWQAIGGTSAATPLLGGGLALVDQALRAQGRRNLGLANPLLYAIATSPLRIGGSPVRSSAFYDVTSSGNDVGPYIPGGNGRPLGCCSARSGYDEASGWGSVDVAQLAQIAVAVQPLLPAMRLSISRQQRLLRRGEMLATVSCSSSCLMAAFARVAIGHFKPFELRSDVYLLRAGGKHTVALKLSGAQLGKLHRGLTAHERIVLTIYASILGPGGNEVRRTRTQRLVVSS